MSARSVLRSAVPSEEPVRLQGLRNFAISVLLLAATLGGTTLAAGQHLRFRAVDPRGAAPPSPADTNATRDVATPDWTVLLPTYSVPVLTRFASSAVLDPNSDRMIVFGGALDNTSYNDVLALTGANGLGASPQWISLIANGAAGSPAARGGHSAVYDSVNNIMIVFGGCCTGPNSDNFNDVWVLNDANGVSGTPTWVQLSPTGGPPAARVFHAAVYDQSDNRMIIFAGLGPGISTFSDVWVLSNANGLGGTPNWTQLSPTGGPPLGQDDLSAVYDPTHKVMTVFGGEINGAFVTTNAVWALSNANGLGGTPKWTNLVANGAAGSPPKREGHRAVYDPASNRMTIFGGGPANFPEPTVFNDTWVLTNANGIGGASSWTKLAPTFTSPARGLPGKRTDHTAVFDLINNRMVIFAGSSAEATYNSVWVLTDANGL
jgi:hypothetical protein